MTKEYRKTMGFTNAGKFKKHLSCKDIFVPNWSLIKQRFDRIGDVFSAVNELLPNKYTGDVHADLREVYNAVYENGILSKLKNHGRAPEDVFTKWAMGYMAEKVFTPTIADKLNLKNIERNGGDDFTSADTFKRVGDADLIDKKLNVRIDVQCGVTGSDATIKKHKVDHALKNSGASYVFAADLYNGCYAIVKLNELKDATFTENQNWEGQLCWDVPENMFVRF